MCEGELGFEEAQLPVARGVLVEVVEPQLAERHDGRVGLEVAQAREVGGGVGLVRVVGVDADRAAAERSGAYTADEHEEGVPT